MVLGWGKKMTQKQADDEEDMSMEEILASIRKYVTEDSTHSPSQAEKRKPDPENDISQFTVEVMPDSAKSAEAKEPNQNDDILDLGSLTPSKTAEIQNSQKDEPASKSNSTITQIEGMAAASSASKPTLEKETKKPSKMEDTASDNSTTTDMGNTMTTQAQNKPTTANDDGIASQETVSASAVALSKLVQAVKPAQAAPSDPQQTAAPTLDKLISDLAKPMVKEWVDQNLSKIVEKMVAKEIEKITKSLI